MDKFSAQLADSYTNLLNKLSEWLNAIILYLPNLAIALIIGVLAFLFSKYVRRLAVKGVSGFTKNRTVLNLISNLAAVVFGIFILFIILGLFNLDSTINKILATAGVLGLAVGLALQDPMNNLFSGVFMSVRELYKIGDLVETNGYFGTITNIDLRATKLRIPTGQEVVIPNKDVIQNPLKNFSASGERRVDLACGVSYGEDLERVEEIAIEAVKGLETLEHRPTNLVYTEFGDSSINFTLRYWIESTNQKDYLMELSKGVKAIKKAFDANDIMIPFPIRTLDFGIKGGVPMSKMLTLKKSEESQESESEASDSNNTDVSEMAS